MFTPLVFQVRITLSFYDSQWIYFWPGAHLNPGITLANCIFRKHPWRKLPKYILAQTLGAMGASGVVYGNYLSAINVFEGGPGMRTVPGFSETASGGIFCTYPAPFMTKTG